MDTFWAELLQKMLVAILPIVASAVVGLLYTMIRAKWAEFKGNQPQWGYAIEQAASLAIKAAEQAGAAGYVDDKKKYALDVAERWLKLNRVPIDLDLIDAAIEAAVFKELNQDKSKAKSPAGFVTE